MNRRSFISKALAGLAAVPLIGKLEMIAPAVLPPPGPTVLTALIPTLHRSMDIVSRELVGFIPAFQTDLLVEAAKVYPRALTDVEIVQAYASARSTQPASSASS
jgi:hypothetical protein